MKLKRWLMPIIYLLIYTGLFLLTWAIYALSDNVNIHIIATLILSPILIVMPFATSVLYGNKFLKDSPRQVWFIIYNASLQSSFYIVFLMITKNYFAILVAIYQFVACILAALPKTHFAKSQEIPTEHTAQIENVTMDDPIE